MRRCAVPLAFVILTFVGVACGTSPAATQDAAPVSEPDRVDPAPTPKPNLQNEPKEADLATPAESSPQPASDDMTAVRELAFAYWEAYNAYDGDKTLAYLEEDYRKLQGEEIRGNMRSMKLFGVKLDVTEETPPHMLVDGEWEMYLTMKTPVDTRRIRMSFLNVEGEWKITFAEQVP